MQEETNYNTQVQALQPESSCTWDNWFQKQKDFQKQTRSKDAICLIVLCYQTTVLNTALISSVIFSWDSLLCHIPDRHYCGGVGACQDKIFLKILLGAGVGLTLFCGLGFFSNFKNSSKLKPERHTQKEFCFRE